LSEGREKKGERTNFVPPGWSVGFFVSPKHAQGGKKQGKQRTPVERRIQRGMPGESRKRGATVWGKHSSPERRESLDGR